MDEKLTITQKSNLLNKEIGIKVFKEFEEVSKNPGEISEEVLLKILNDNKNTEYGKKYDFINIHNTKEYQEKVPVIEYSDIKEYIERMKLGEKNLLTSYSFQHMNETAGTSGTPKNIPLTEEQSKIFLKYNNQYIYGLIDKYLNPNWINGKTFSPAEGKYIKLDSGITVGCAASKVADVIKGDFEPFSSQYKAMFTSPVEAMIPGIDIDTKYIHIRFALTEKDISGIAVPLLTNIAVLIDYLCINYDLLINDIEKGTINQSIQLPNNIRKDLLKKIEPMPERANELREIFKDGPETEIISKIWPTMQYIWGVGGNDFESYDNYLKKHHNGKIHNIYAGITSSEALISVPKGIDTLDTILVPDAGFIEFLDVEHKGDYSKSVTIDKLEEGKIYEIITTSFNGLYRYRLSDAVKVTGFYNKTPVVRFMYRLNKTINLSGEKTTELMLKKVADRTAKEFGLKLIDYAVYSDTTEIPGKYVFLLETLNFKRLKISKEKVADVILENICEINPQFKWRYDINRLGKPEVYFIKPGTQLKFRQKMIKKQGNSQFKPVRVINNKEQKEYFLNAIEN